MHPERRMVTPRRIGIWPVVTQRDPAAEPYTHTMRCGPAYTRDHGRETCDPRWATPRTRRRTLGPQVTAAARRIGLDLLPWQKQVVNAALEQVRGRPAYRDVVV